MPSDREAAKAQMMKSYDSERAPSRESLRINAERPRSREGTVDEELRF